MAKEFTYFNPNTENLIERFGNRPQTTMTPFFKLCSEDPEAVNLFYADVLKY